MAAESTALHLVAPAPQRPEWARLLTRYRHDGEFSISETARASSIHPRVLERIESADPLPPSAVTLRCLAKGLGLEQWQEDRLLVAAGYVPSYVQDRTVRQVARLLAGDAVLAAALRAQVNALDRMTREGDE